MIKKAARKEVLVAMVVLISLCFTKLHAKDDSMQTNKSVNTSSLDIVSLTNTPFVSTNAALPNSLQRIADERERFMRPEVLVVTGELQQKAADIKKAMKQTGSYEQAKKPQTLDEAIDFLLGNMSLARFPAACFEYDGVYYFSSLKGNSTKRIKDFSSGFAIRKGESKIYTWSSSDKAEVEKHK